MSEIFTTTSEKDLIEACIEGNRKSQKELYEELSPKMYAYCKQICSSQKEVEDVLTTGFITLYNSLHSYDGLVSFEKWAESIFRKTADLYKSSKEEYVFSMRYPSKGIEYWKTRFKTSMSRIM